MRFLLLFTVCATSALCQQAQIAGLIQDPAELNVSGALITVRNEQTGGRRETQSNASGFYSVASLSPGTYRILVRCQGFQTIVREDVRLEVGDNARVDFTLRIGDSQTVVTVNGGAPLMNTEDASIGTVIGRDLIDEMPLNGRGIQGLIELTPGVEAVPVIVSNAGQFSVNGQRSISNYFTVDGVSANFGAGVLSNSVSGAITATSQAGAAANNLMGTFSNLVSPDALQEFRIQTSTFAPEFGHVPGAQIGLVTRSGTNRYSGSLFEYFRNNVFDANDWFSNRQGLPKAPLRFNNFGGTLGGPLRIPHLRSGDDRTFFFFSFEDLTMRQPQPPILIAVPDAQARLSLSPLSAPIYDALPLPNLPASSVGATAPGWAGFGFGFSQPVDQRTWGFRVDHYFSDKLIGFARYNLAPSHEKADLGILSYPLNPLQLSAGTGMLTTGVTESINPALVNEARGNFSWQTVSGNSQVLTLNGAQPFPAALLFPPGSSPQNSQVSIDDFSTPGVPSFLVGLDTQSKSRQIQVVDQLSYTKGRHQFKFGLEYRRLTLLETLPQTSNIYIFFDLPDGQAPSVIQEVTPARLAYQTPNFSLYAQDTWHVLPRLTVTYGLRWEVDPAPRATSDNVSLYNPLPASLDLSALSLAPPGTPFYRTQYTNFAPRIGLALQLPGLDNTQMVLRAGAGTFYDSSQGEFESAGAAPTNLYSYSGFPIGSFPGGSSPLAGSGPQFAPVTVAGYAIPRTYEWNVTLEQSFGSQTVSAAYVGAVGRRLLGAAADTALVLPSTIPPQGLEIFGNSFSSSYHALQVQFNRRMSKRVQALISYTWSHAIDNRSDEDGTSLGELQDPSVLLDPNQNRGDSDFDIRQSLHGALYVALPAPAHGRGAVLLRNWTASTIFFARTAMPTNLLFDGASAYGPIEIRPDVVPGQPLYLYSNAFPGGKSINSAAFASPPDGVAQGDLGRNALRGFGAWQADVALHRQFRLSEHTSLQLRVEAFNLLNHPNFAPPSDPGGGAGTQTISELAPGGLYGVSQLSLAGGLSSAGTLGQLNQLFQIGGPRSLQFALRLAF